ncbi:unnamed protein product, partial [Heterotrigona itama]
YLSITQAKQVINLLFLSNNFYPYRYHTNEFKKKATSYSMRFGHSLWSANQLPTQGAKQVINLLFLSNNFYPYRYHTNEFKKKATSYSMRFGHSLWSVDQLPAQ